MAERNWLKLVLAAALFASALGCDDSSERQEAEQTVPEIVLAPAAPGPRGTLTVRFPNRLEGSHVSVGFMEGASERRRVLADLPVRLTVPIGTRLHVWGTKVGYIGFEKYLTLTPDTRHREVVIALNEVRPSGLFGLAKSELRKDTGLSLLDAPVEGRAARYLYTASGLWRFLLVIDENGDVWRAIPRQRPNPDQPRRTYMKLGTLDPEVLHRLVSLMEPSTRGSLQYVGGAEGRAGSVFFPRRRVLSRLSRHEYS